MHCSPLTNQLLQAGKKKKKQKQKKRKTQITNVILS